MDDSLTRFLVTFVLHETVIGCEHLGTAGDVIGQLTAAGMHVSPLWIDHPYPAFIEDCASRPTTFHVANGTHLVMDNYRCATNVESPWSRLPTIFKPRERRTSSGGLDPYEAIPDHIQLPGFIRRDHLQQAIRRHDGEAEYHRRRSELFRKMLAKMDDPMAGE